MTQLQKLYFESGKRQKLIELSYEKIRLTRSIGGKFSETYFQALALIDMAAIHQTFEEEQMALEKLDGALGTFLKIQLCQKELVKNQVSKLKPFKRKELFYPKWEKDWAQLVV